MVLGFEARRFLLHPSPLPSGQHTHSPLAVNSRQGSHLSQTLNSKVLRHWPGVGGGGRSVQEEEEGQGQVTQEPRMTGGFIRDRHPFPLVSARILGAKG